MRRQVARFEPPRLLRHQREVLPFRRHQARVRAALCHATLPHHQDQVGVFHRAQPMRDDERRAGPVGHRRVEPGLDLFFRFRVQRRGGFVQDQHVGVAHQGPGESQALPLSSREQTISNPCLVASR